MFRFTMKAFVAAVVLLMPFSRPASAHVEESDVGTPNVANYPVCPAGTFRRWNILDTGYQNLPDDPDTIRAAAFAQGRAELGNLHGCTSDGHSNLGHHA